MDFGALPPEVNSGRMYLGPGPATLLAASAGWDSLALELNSAASGYESVITTLTEEWLGPTSMSMAAAVAPYVVWLRAIAELCEQSAMQATAAAAAYEAAYAMTVPPPLIAANRAQLMALIATNFLGQNTPAIMATEAVYSEMWARDATAMYTYAASSASASTFSAFAPPPQTTNPGGVAGQAGAVTHATATQAGSSAQTASSQVMSSVPQALQSMSTPGSTSSAGLSQAAVGSGASLGTSGASSPLGALSSLTGTSKGATKTASTGVRTASSLTSALGGGANGGTAGLASDAWAWAPTWPASAAMARAWAPTEVESAWTSTACRSTSRARIRFSGPRAPPVRQASEAWVVWEPWGPSVVWAKALRRAWARRPHSGPCRCRRVGLTPCRR